MMEEPQQLVAHPVVELLIRGGVNRDQPQRVFRIGHDHVETAARSSLRLLPVSLAHRCRHPQTSGGLHRRSQPSDEAPAAPFGYQLALVRLAEHHGSTVGGHQDPAIAHSCESSSRYSVISRTVRNRSRTRAFPAAPILSRSHGFWSNSKRRSAHCSTESTRYPVFPSSTCSLSPPAFPAMTGFPFHIASETVRPKPSRIDFCKRTSESLWNAFTAVSPTPCRLVSTWTSGSEARRSSVCSR